MRTKHFFTMARICLVVLALTLSVWGQVGNQGSIEGTILDQKGGAVPGASLTLKNMATGATFTASSDEYGLFRFPVVPVGTYQLTAEKSGFATFTQKDIELTVGAKLNLSLGLPVATQQSSVVVTAEVPVVETTRTSVSATVNDKAVANLPVLGRNFINFVLLTPGVTLDRRDGDLSFAGMRGTLNSLVVDGSDNNNTFFGQTTGRTGSGRAPYQFSQDAVEEFQVNSNAYTAEMGHAGGAVINVVTKSGSNNFHGTAFEFYRDTSLNANDIINKSRGQQKSPLHFNQFGGNVGGPVVKDKLFFLFDYDGQRNTLPNFTFLNLPTPFTVSSDPNIGPHQQRALDYLTPRAAPWTRLQNQDVYLGKIDWHITARNLLTGRINSQRFTGGNFENGGTQNSLEHTGASLVSTDTVTISLTTTLSASLINVARSTYLRDDEPGQANSPNPEATVRQGVTVLVVGRNFFSPRFTNIKRGQWSDTLSWVRGRHALKFGADLIVDRIANFFPGNFSGNYTFNSLESFGRSLAGMAQRVPGDVSYLQAFAGTGTTGPTTSPNILEHSEFVQDEWRARNNLTLTFGLRYDTQLMAQPTGQNPAALAAGLDTGRIHNDHKDFGPRFGFAWTPLASNRLVVRGGYGIFYGRTPSIMVGTAHSNNGLNVVTLNFSGSAIPQYPNNICGAPDSSGASPSCAPPSGGSSNPPIIFIFSPGYVQPQVQQASFGLEYELAKDLALTVSYLGVKGTHVQRTRDINLNPATITSTVAVNNDPASVVSFQRYVRPPRPIAAFDRIAQFESSSSSIYHGLILQLNKRFSHNFQFAASYTFGKALDDNPDATAVVPGGSDDAKLAQYSTNPHDDRGLSQNDQRHRFVVSGVWDLNNYAKSLPTLSKAILGGWELSGIFTAQKGQPYSGLVGFDLNNDGNSRADRFPGAGRDIFQLPGIVTLDPRITRSIPIGETRKVQLILEAFNVFNRGNIFGVITTQFTRAATCTVASVSVCLTPSTTFGRPASTTFSSLSARIVQLAAKFVF